MKNKKLLIIAIAAVLVFIWGNSLLSREASQLLSDSVQSGLIQISGGDTSGGVNSAVLRKVAHFCEFAALGGLTALLLRGRKKGCLKAFAFSAACAAIDETIQIFSNRGSSVADVILDCFGAGFGVLVIFLFLTRKDK
ncbi:MAG: VanZ family protein [Oscillospiraceae bacterium]